MNTTSRVAAVALLTLSVALLHGWGIGHWHVDVPAAPPAHRAALQTRSVVRSFEPSPLPAPTLSPARRVAIAPPASQPMPVPPAEPAASSSAGAMTDAQVLPTYRTRVPPPVQWTYSIERGLLTGEGVLHWQPDGDRYTARLEGRVAGMAVLNWTSRGGFDSAGIAPERFLVRRRGRDAQAANFQREASKITYSGPAVEHPLHAGTQDRLSWMLQLPAIVAATPERFAAAGASVSMFVSGARGDADVWTFTLREREKVSLAGGVSVDALKFEREPRKPYDTRVEVWLDPAQHHLPVKARLSVEGRDDALELRHAPSL